MCLGLQAGSYPFTKDTSKLTLMDIIYFTLTAILLYLAADWILKRIEAASGKPMKYRNMVFFAILLLMAVTSFALIRNLTGS